MHRQLLFASLLLLPHAARAQEITPPVGIPDLRESPSATRWHVPGTIVEENEDGTEPEDTAGDDFQPALDPALAPTIDESEESLGEAPLGGQIIEEDYEPATEPAVVPAATPAAAVMPVSHTPAPAAAAPSPGLMVPSFSTPPSPVITTRKEAPSPFWFPRLGIGVRTSAIQMRDGAWSFGVGGEMVLLAVANLSIEVGAEYQKAMRSMIERADIPLTLGMRIHMSDGDWPVSPYVALAGGFDVATARIRDMPRSSLYLQGEIGGGLEFRFGPRASFIAEGRLIGRVQPGTYDPFRAYPFEHSNLGGLARVSLSINL